MRPPFLLRTAVVFGLAFCLFAGDAFAGFFRRYPDATEESTPAAPSRPAQTDVSDGTEAYTPRAEPEADPGLFRTLPHGSGGLTMEYIYTGEVFNNMRGGLNTKDATEYRGNLDLVMTADLDEIGFAPGGIIFLYGQNGHGRGISGRHVGETQTISNIDAPEFMQMSEFWWERGFCDDIFRLRIGKQDAAAAFGFVEASGDFINGVFGAPVTIPLPTFPDPTMAAVTFVQLTEDLVFQCGIFDGAAAGNSWGFSDTGEPFTIFEFRGNYESLRGMPGQYHVGMWHHDGVFENPANAAITH
ncbi:MAG TPA: carbohydrate porin, partial [Thermoguttaceae bacterium]|nr:carbohydrate porin [Thermoguttaceae bacterium]